MSEFKLGYICKVCKRFILVDDWDYENDTCKECSDSEFRYRWN